MSRMRTIARLIQRKKYVLTLFTGVSEAGRKGMSKDDSWNEEMEEAVEEKLDEQESFAGMFEAYSAGMKEDIHVGDKIRGEVLSIGKDSVFVDTGTKIDGFVEKQELLDENGELSLKIGDFVELYAVSVTGAEIRLSKAVAGIGGMDLLMDAFEEEIPVEGKVKSLLKGGYEVEVLQRRAFCPISQIALRYVEKPEEYVGQTTQFLIIEFDEEARNIVVSRRKLLDKELEKERKAFYEGLSVGLEMEGKVTQLMPYGAFVEIGPGVEGMVHISELGWSRVEKPDDILNTGDTVLVRVLGLESGKKPNQIKISLSIKQTMMDPWESVARKYQVGESIRGKVTRCAAFGAFVELMPGIEGLVHISEMSYTRRVSKPEDIVTPGDSVQVLIKEVDQTKRRISLSLRDVAGDPWGDVETKYRVGQIIKGKVEKREKFGLFISLEPGITALLPKSKFKESTGSGEMEKLKPGDAVAVVIERVNADERKITVAPGDAENVDDWRSFSSNKGTAMSSLGEKLQQALQTKDRKKSGRR